MSIDERKVKWDSEVSIDESKIQWDEPKAIDESKIKWDEPKDEGFIQENLAGYGKAPEDLTTLEKILRGVSSANLRMQEAVNGANDWLGNGIKPTQEELYNQKWLRDTLESDKEKLSQANITPERKQAIEALKQQSANARGFGENAKAVISTLYDTATHPSEWTAQGVTEGIFSPENIASINPISKGATVGARLFSGAGNAALENVLFGTPIDIAQAKGQGKSDEEIKNTAIQSAVGNLLAGATIGGTMTGLKEGYSKLKSKPDTIEEYTQTPTNFDAQSYLDSTKASKASDELGLNDNPNYKTMEEIKQYIAENDKGGQAQADLFEQQMNLWAKAENLRRAEEGREPVTAEQMANDFILKYEAQPKEVVNENVTTDNLQNHPRFQELMDMRRDVSSKDTQYSQTLVQPRGTDADGNWYGASYDRNFNADFELTKADVKAIESGKATPEQITKLRNDLGRLENDPMYRQELDANEQLAANGELFSKAYHGTPHEVDKFSTDKIGTGEGAQAYGWGMYFADSKKVAEWYRDNLKPRNDSYIIDGTIYDRLDLTTAEVHALSDILKYGYDDALSINERWVQSKANPRDIDIDTLEAVKMLKGKSIKEAKGNLYRVELKPKEEEYLLWDKPLDDQSLHVKEALQKELDMYRKSEGAKGAYVNNSSGEKLYKEFIYTYGSDKKASERLNELGIKGIKYEDGNSRSRDVNKNHNYVIFNNKDVDITGANGKMFDGTPDALFQNKEVIKGSYTIDQKLIQIFKDSDFSTINHELGHRFLFTLNARERAVAEQAFGVKDGNWKVENHEAFADAYARYIADGKVQSSGLKAIFEKFKEFTKKILSDLQANNGGKLPPMSKDAKEFFRAMLGDEVARAELLKKMEGKEAKPLKGSNELFQKIEYTKENEDFKIRASEKIDNIVKVTKSYAYGKRYAPEKVYRGVSGDGILNNEHGASSEGIGLYTTANKSLAKDYGRVIELDKSNIPSNPLVFRDLNHFEIWHQQIMYNVLGYKRASDFRNITINEIVDVIDKSIDGLQIGEGKKAFWVKYPDINSLIESSPNELFQTSKERQDRLMEWHKDSAPETKNADGTPKVFYHGTMSKKSFTEFNTENSPSWFTPNKSYAGAFAPVGGNIFEVYLHVKKPMWVGDIDGIINDVSLKRLSDNSGVPLDKLKDIRKNIKGVNIFNITNNKDFVDIAKSMGYDGIEAIEGRTKTLAVFNPTQIKSIHNKGTFDENNPNILYQRTDLSVGDETLMESVQRKVQDKFLRVKKLIEAKANINAIADKLNPYLAEELYHGRVQNRLDQFQKDYVEPIIKKISSSKVTIDQVDEYLHARHAIERNRKMEELNGIKDGSGMSDAEAVRILAKYANNTDMLDIAKMVYAMNKDRLKLIYKEGLESADFIKTIDGTYNNYVPLKRVMDSDGNYMSTGKGFDIKGKELKRAKGSNREVESPLLNSILAFNETIIRAEKNEVGKAMINFAEAYPDANLYEVNSLKHVPQYDSNGDVISMNPKYQLANNVLHVKIDGKVKEIVFKDPLLARAFKNLSSEQMGAVMQGAQKLIRYYASINTQYNPDFVISNFERDLQTAMINLPEEVKGSRAIILRDVFSAMNGIHKAIYERTPNEWSKLYAEMKAEGGTTGWIEQYNVPDMKKSTEILIKKYEGEVMPKEAFKAVLDHIDNINTVIENASRLVVYKMAKESGLSNKRSASIAKNLTVNFNRKGEMGQALNLMYMFFNASIQGTTRTIQAIRHSKVVQGIVGGIVASSTALALYNMSQNEEAYSLIPQYEKDTNLIFMNEDGTYKKVKVPYGYNVFKSLGDIMAEAYNGDLKPEKMPSRILGVAVNAFSPIGTAPTLGQMLTPTIARPAVDLEVNKNFAGNPIQPEKSGFGASSPDSYNYFNSVNPIAKSIAQEANKLTGGNMYKSGMADVSPETIEYLFETATGGVGKFFNRVYKTASGNAETNDIPFVRNFIGETTDKSKQSKVYDIYKRSGEEIIDQKELDRFVKFGREGVSNGSIEPDRFISMVTTIASNQAKLKWADRNDIQSKDDVLNSPSIMMDALQSGVPKSEILSIAKKKKKEDEALLKR